MTVSTLPESPITHPPKPRVLNLPNSLTLARLTLSIVLFVLLELGREHGDVARWHMSGFIVFTIAASTDWLDGYLARKRGEVTTLGRILDPFVDKVVVLGTVVFLLATPDSGLAPWMVTLVIARELLVTGLRSFLEGENVPFGADWAGKIKMVLQCAAIGAVLLYLGAVKPNVADHAGTELAWAKIARDTTIWIAVAVTAASGVSYAWKAALLISARERA